MCNISSAFLFVVLVTFVLDPCRGGDDRLFFVQILSPKDGDTFSCDDTENIGIQLRLQFYNVEQIFGAKLIVNGKDWHTFSSVQEQPLINVMMKQRWPHGMHIMTIQVFDANEEELDHKNVTFFANDGSGQLRIGHCPTISPDLEDNDVLWADTPAQGDEEKEAKTNERIDPPRFKPGMGFGKWSVSEDCWLHGMGIVPISPFPFVQYALTMETLGRYLVAANALRIAIRIGLQSPDLGIDGRGVEGCEERIRWLLQQQKEENAMRKKKWKKQADRSLFEEENPYISVISVARHDGTRFCQSPRDSCLDRLRASGSIMSFLFAKYRIPAEFIYIEYAPTHEPGFMRLQEVIERLVTPYGNISIRILTVTKQIHEKIWNPHGFSLLEFIGKNSGARRARGKFLLFTNPDDCISEELVEHLAQKRLLENAFYGTFRGAVHFHVPIDEGASGQSMSRYVQHNSYATENVELSPHHKRDHWRYAPCNVSKVMDDNDNDNVEPWVSLRYGDFYDSAAGDFFLTSRKVFEAISGYPEIPNNIFIDGTAIHAAAGHGFGQILFRPPCVIYHQEHPRSFNTGQTTMSFEKYEEIVQEMLKKKEKANHNPGERDSSKRDWTQFNFDDEWGLINESLQEVVLIPE